MGVCGFVELFSVGLGFSRRGEGWLVVSSGCCRLLVGVAGGGVSGSWGFLCDGVFRVELSLIWEVLCRLGAFMV